MSDDNHSNPEIQNPKDVPTSGFTQDQLKQAFEEFEQSRRAQEPPQLSTDEIRTQLHENPVEFLRKLQLDESSVLQKVLDTSPAYADTRPEEPQPFQDNNELSQFFQEHNTLKERLDSMAQENEKFKNYFREIAEERTRNQYTGQIGDFISKGLSTPENSSKYYLTNSFREQLGADELKKELFEAARDLSNRTGGKVPEISEVADLLESRLRRSAKAIPTRSLNQFQKTLSNMQDQGKVELTQKQREVDDFERFMSGNISAEELARRTKMYKK